MTVLNDNHNPSFWLMPVNNNRTAWKPISLPIILIVPHKRDAGGTALPNSSVFNVRVYIEDVPQEARIAGHQNIGRRFPDKELYSETIDALQLAERQLELANLTINRNGEEVSLEDANSGDSISYTCAAGVRDTIPFLVGADYYDLSDILLDVELLPSDLYNLVYETQYYKRVASQDGRSDFLCIDNIVSLTLLKFQIDHPGKVLEEFHRLTPPPYLTNAVKSQDTTLALYRPFTDLLQDVMDEQSLLERINWVFDAPAEVIPYLSTLLGWDIPYFPQSLDQLRRAVLRRTVEFQNLKGSRRAIINIFRLFGFEILISNLWWSADGLRTICPDESLPLKYKDQEITTVAVDQVDAILNDFSITDFTTLSIPLLYRPQEKTGLDQFTALRDSGHLTVTVYAVNQNSDAQIALDGIMTEIIANPAGYGATADCQTDADGFYFANAITSTLSGKEIAGYSQIKISGKMGNPNGEILVGPIVPVRSAGVHLNRETNTLTLTFNGFSELADKRLYGFVSYQRYEFRVPDVLAELQSNRFDLQVLTKALDEFADPTTLEFAVEFLYKLKAFHSLLNVIRTRIELTETYEVTDLCVGGDFEQRYDTDIGRLQVPPAIIPNIPSDLSDCSLLDPKSLGYKDSDVQLRLRKLTNLPEEHTAWKALDGRDATRPNGSRITPNQPAADRTECLYTPYGQDRKTTGERTESYDTQLSPTPLSNSGATGFSKSPELSPQDENAQSTSTNSDSGAYGSFMREFRGSTTGFCELDKISDYCYKGRVGDELLYRPTFIGQEPGGIRPIYVGLGAGVYWLYPAFTKSSNPGVRHRDSRSRTTKMRFSGGAPEASQFYYREGIQSAYLNQPYNQKPSIAALSLLGRLYRDYGMPTGETLHFSNRNDSPIIDQRKQLALQRPSLEIIKPILHFPGCRFPMLNRLQSDYISSDEARPWDFDVCGVKGMCGRTDPTFLNFRMVVGTDGNEQLTYNSTQYTIIGNNLIADIISLGETQVDVTDDIIASVIHKIYLGDANDNPAVELEEVVGYDSVVADGTIITEDPIFTSHADCDASPPQVNDFADGYPAITGLQDYDLPESTLYDDLLTSLGTPSGAVTGTQVLFLLGSGIRDDSTGFRLDGGCLLVDCEPTLGRTSLCAYEVYRDNDGLLDFEPDHLEIETALTAEESMAIELTLLDGTIGSLLETI